MIRVVSNYNSQILQRLHKLFDEERNAVSLLQYQCNEIHGKVIAVQKRRTLMARLSWFDEVVESDLIMKGLAAPRVNEMQADR